MFILNIKLSFAKKAIKQLFRTTEFLNSRAAIASPVSVSLFFCNRKGL